MIIYVDGRGMMELTVPESSNTDADAVLEDTLHTVFPFTEGSFKMNFLSGFKQGDLYAFARVTRLPYPHPDNDPCKYILVKADGWGHYVDITEEDVATFTFGQKLLLETTEFLKEIGYYPSDND